MKAEGRRKSWFSAINDRSGLINMPGKERERERLQWRMATNRHSSSQKRGYNWIIKWGGGINKSNDYRHKGYFRVPCVQTKIPCGKTKKKDYFSYAVKLAQFSPEAGIWKTIAAVHTHKTSWTAFQRHFLSWTYVDQWMISAHSWQMSHMQSVK